MTTMPDWAIAEVWLGWWCRRYKPDNQRLLVAAVLPTRGYAGALAGLGSVLAGADQFQSGFTWEDFRNLPKDSEIHWKLGDRRYTGVIQGVHASADTLISVRISRSRRRQDIGVDWAFSPRMFSECIFSEEHLPSPQRNLAMEHTLRLYAGLGLDTNPRWIWTSGAEARLVTNQTKFWASIAGLRMSSRNSDPVTFRDVLFAAGDNDSGPAKLRVCSTVKDSSDETPVTILDGATTLSQIQHIEAGSVLILLDRAEYTPEIHNIMLDASDAAAVPLPQLLEDVPARMPPGFEIAAFVLPQS